VLEREYLRKNIKIMYKKTLLTVMITAMCLISGYTRVLSDDLRIGGYARNYTGVLTGGENELSILQNTFNLNVSQRGDRIAFRVNPFLYHYFDNELELGLREAYLDMYFSNFDLRIGKQQIIWGKAEGVFITDIVSPKDLREFLLPDFDEIRMGITAVKLNYYFGTNTVEAVWSPVFTPTLMPERGSIWRPQMDFPVEPEIDDSSSEIIPSLNNSELFLRYSTLSTGMDIELVGGYFWYDDPALHVERDLDPETMEIRRLTIQPQYHRVSMAGGSFSMPAGPFLLRGEGAYYSGRYFQTLDPLVSDAVVRKDNLHYMAGIDYTFAGIRMSAQFIQEYILGYDRNIRNDELESTMTFLARKDYFREKLWVELFSYIGLNHGDALVRPKATYYFADGFEVLGGANIFIGDSGRFGQFSDNNMLYIKLKYSF
jgi:hypothetical protein